MLSVQKHRKSWPRQFVAAHGTVATSSVAFYSIDTHHLAPDNRLTTNPQDAPAAASAVPGAGKLAEPPC